MKKLIIMFVVAMAMMACTGNKTAKVEAPVSADTLDSVAIDSTICLD